MSSTYVFPVEGGQVTAGYYDPRPYSKPPEKRDRFHKGWDIASDAERPEILAPETGKLYFHMIVRAPNDYMGDQFWPNSRWYAFSNFYFDTYGCLTLLHGDSGRWYVFAHQDPDTMFSLVRDYGIMKSWTREGDGYNRYVRAYLTLDMPVGVSEGDPVGHIGNSGYSTGSHLHMQIHKNRSYQSRIDPAELWPDVYIGSNGDGPDRGPKK